jgi:hypothetical protein
MDRIILNVIEKKMNYNKRVVMEVKGPLYQCDFITIGEELMFDKDTDFFTFGIDVGSGDKQLAIVTGEYIPLPPDELIEEIKKSLNDTFDIVEDNDVQLWLRQKSA